MVDIRLLIDGQNNLGEGPLWDAAEQKLYWVDSIDRWIFRIDADGGNLEKWRVPERHRIDGAAQERRRGAVACATASTPSTSKPAKRR